MTKILTIALPTFNRAELLEQQLAWLARSIRGFESRCEIIISDNGSNDKTPEVIEKWRNQFSGIALKLNRHPKNIGAIRNIAYCISSATSQYVWTISDDDRIEDKTISYLLNLLTEFPELNLVILNFSSRDVRTNKLNFERCFQVNYEESVFEGKALFEQCLMEDSGGVTLTTALVYRTNLAQSALRCWPAGLENLAVQLYITGYCALRGKIKLTQETYLECSAGNHFWVKDLALRLRLRVAEMPETYVKLMELGYSKEVCRQMILVQWREILTHKKLILKGFLQSPQTTINVLSRFILAWWRLDSELRPTLQNRKNQGLSSANLHTTKENND